MSLSLAILASVPDALHFLAMSASVCVMHLLGWVKAAVSLRPEFVPFKPSATPCLLEGVCRDMPSPFVVGLVKDSLAPACARLTPAVREALRAEPSERKRMRHGEAASSPRGRVVRGCERVLQGSVSEECLKEAGGLRLTLFCIYAPLLFAVAAHATAAFKAKAAIHRKRFGEEASTVRALTETAEFAAPGEKGLTAAPAAPEGLSPGTSEKETR